MSRLNFIKKECIFQTQRLLVAHWESHVSSPLDERVFAENIVSILSPKVTQSLPDGWQRINSEVSAIDWMKKRSEESHFLTVQMRPDKKIIGFIFIYEVISNNECIDIHLGYLLSESFWGRGLASELIKGLITWCELTRKIQSIICGVEEGNVGSIKVLEKSGFCLSSTKGSSKGMLFGEYKIGGNL